MRKMFPLIVLLRYVPAVYSDGHSLRYYETVVSAPGSGLPEYSEVGYVDDREITNYNSDTKRMRPKVRWMEKEESGYWEEQTRIGKQTEAVARHDVRTLMSRFNQSGGFGYKYLDESDPISGHKFPTLHIGGIYTSAGHIHNVLSPPYKHQVSALHLLEADPPSPLSIKSLLSTFWKPTLRLSSTTSNSCGELDSASELV